MKGVSGSGKILFYARHSEDVTGVWIVECSLCAWDLVDWCECYLDRECSAADLMKTHARAHGGVPRLTRTFR